MFTHMEHDCTMPWGGAGDTISYSTVKYRHVKQHDDIQRPLPRAVKGWATERRFNREHCWSDHCLLIMPSLHKRSMTQTQPYLIAGQLDTNKDTHTHTHTHINHISVYHVWSLFLAQRGFPVSSACLPAAKLPRKTQTWCQSSHHQLDSLQTQWPKDLRLTAKSYQPSWLVIMWNAGSKMVELCWYQWWWQGFLVLVYQLAIQAFGISTLGLLKGAFQITNIIGMIAGRFFWKAKP